MIESRNHYAHRVYHLVRQITETDSWEEKLECLNTIDMEFMIAIQKHAPKATAVLQRTIATIAIDLKKAITAVHADPWDSETYVAAFFLASALAPDPVPRRPKRPLHTLAPKQ